MISHAHLPFTLSRVFVHAFLLSPTYGCCCCYSKSLEFLVSLWLREAQRWWSWKLTRQFFRLFLWLRSLFVERVEKWRSPGARWKNCENLLASANHRQPKRTICEFGLRRSFGRNILELLVYYLMLKKRKNLKDMKSSYLFICTSSL